MYGLNNLGDYLQSGDQANLKVFLSQVDWLGAQAVIREDGVVVWPHDFHHQESAVRLKAPWLSANAQRFVISALVRGWRITRRPRLLELLERTLRSTQKRGIIAVFQRRTARRYILHSN